MQKLLLTKLKQMKKKKIANKFNDFLIKIEPELAKEVPGPARSLESYVPKFSATIPTRPVSANELKNAIFSIKTNKCPGNDKSNFNVINSWFKLCETLQYLFNLYFQKNIFLDDSKIAKVTPVFKVGNSAVTR